MNGEDIFTKNGPILLLAGPGTGKTHKLAERIKYLVEDAGISPDRITVLTFTNQAAINMRRRLSNVEKRNLYLPGAQHPKRISTLHSLGHTVITDCSQKLKLPRKVAIVKDRIREIIVRDAAQLSGFTSEAADAVVQCRQFGNCQPGREDNCEICYKYREITLACGAVDHDDQILLAYQLLSEDNALLNEYQSEATHLLIDEYQDINPGQFRLIKLLSGGQEEGLFVVGDDDQSIYSWRGGSPEFIRNFL